MFDLTPFDFGNRMFANYDPFKEMEEMERRFFGSRTPGFQTDIRETEQAYILEADLPGFSKEDIRAEVKDGYLTIYAERKNEEEKKDEKGNYIRRERSFGSYRRTFDLSGIRAEEITASYKNGVLSLTLPKEEAKIEQPRRLDIQSLKKAVAEATAFIYSSLYLARTSSAMDAHSCATYSGDRIFIFPPKPSTQE